MEEYHVRVKGRALGPYPLDRLRQMARNGEVGRMHEVSTDGLSWAPATSFPEIFERAPVAELAATPDAAGGGPDVTANAPAVAPPDRSAVAPAAREPLWYRDRQGTADGPMPRDRLVAMIQRGEVAAATFVFKEGTQAWVRAADASELAAGFAVPVGAGDPSGGEPPSEGTLSSFEFVDRPRRYRGARRSKDVATVLAMLLGGLGIHHFYLGNPALGVVYLLFCWTLIPAVVGFIEGLTYLSMSGYAFDQKYNR